jgi:hypothetical protein
MSMIEDCRAWQYGAEYYDFDHDIFLNRKEKTLEFSSAGGQCISLWTDGKYSVEAVSPSKGFLNVEYLEGGLCPRLEPFQKKKNGIPFKIEKGTYIFSGPWDQVLYFDR